MNIPQQVSKLISMIELEPCRFKRMSMLREVRRLEGELNRVRGDRG
jgi:hypothetical protein